jgi:hypothetical protein
MLPQWQEVPDLSGAYESGPRRGPASATMQVTNGAGVPGAAAG